MSKTRVYIISGHYGSGKTNIAINLAYELKKTGSTAIFDLDIVNPYFRTADFTKQLAEGGIDVYAPLFANTNLDTPALTGEFARIYSGAYDYAVVDVGGDDSGAVALGQYAGKIKSNCEYEHLYIVNFSRTLTMTIADNIELMRDIEASGNIPYTGIVNNTNLAGATTAQTVEESFSKAAELAAAAGIPLVSTSVNEGIELKNCPTDIYHITLFTKRYW